MLDLKNTRIEYHILQSFPVTCLNRDDVGAPKTAVVGGVTRARVSSQCWKRHVRLTLPDFGITLGLRTKKIAEIVANECVALGATKEQAMACGEKVAELLVNKKQKNQEKKKKEENQEDKKEDKKDVLIFISSTEGKALAQYIKTLEFDESKIKDKDLVKEAKKALTPAFDALDIALFGRMVAKAADMNIEAAASFSHAISTHRVSNEVEFFTAMDDLQTEPGSAHMGSLEFNSATYYRYISLDLGQLAQTLGTEEHPADAEQLQTAIEAFTKALFVAVPSARQTTQSGASPWDFAKVLVRKGQRLQLSFENPVKAKQDGFLAPSIDELKATLVKKAQLSGSLFGQLGDYEWGEDANFSIDDLIAKLKSHVE